MLKPQDIVILLKIAVQPQPYEWSYNQLAYELRMSASEVHAGVKRAVHARLFDKNRKRPIRNALEEFLIHGVKYAFAPEIGTVTRGVPTAGATPSQEAHLVVTDGDIYVWPHPEGKYRGIALSPLYKTVPEMVAHDVRLYEALGWLDAMRVGRSRDMKIAKKILLDILRHDESR